MEKQTMSAASRGYLVTYNCCQILGWTAMLITILHHLGSEFSPVGLYSSVETLLKIFQTAALLEVIHCAIGIVHSNLKMTTFQVASRVFLTWGVVHSVPSVQNSAGVTMLLFAWTTTEIVRYTFYLFTLLGSIPHIIQWCRYTFFIALYPLGVTGELLAIWRSLSEVTKKELYYLKMPNVANMSFNYTHFLILVMVSYLPVFPQLFIYMINQRKKVLISRINKSK